MFHHFWRAIIEANKKKFIGRWESDFKQTVFLKINSRFGRSILKTLWRTHVRPDLHRIGHLDRRVKNICFPALSKETLFLEGRWECLKMVGTASSFSMFLGFVPINSACKSRLKQDGSTDSVSGMNFLFGLCNHFFLISSFFDESRWKLIFLFLLFPERLVPRCSTVSHF